MFYSLSSTRKKSSYTLHATISEETAVPPRIGGGGYRAHKSTFECIPHTLKTFARLDSAIVFVCREHHRRSQKQGFVVPSRYEFLVRRLQTRPNGRSFHASVTGVRINTLSES